jgi:phosphoglucomutase
MKISPLAGKLAEQDIPVNLPRFVTAHYSRVPDSNIPDQRVAFGTFCDRIESKETPEQKEKLKKLSSSQIKHKNLAGEEIKLILTNAPGNNASIGDVKVTTENGRFAARPSGTEDVYKIYGESFLSKDHLKKIIDEAQTIANAAL